MSDLRRHDVRAVGGKLWGTTVLHLGAILCGSDLGQFPRRKADLHRDDILAAVGQMRRSRYRNDDVA